MLCENVTSILGRQRCDKRPTVLEGFIPYRHMVFDGVINPLDCWVFWFHVDLDGNILSHQLFTSAVTSDFVC